jgi:hypothetical protein
MLQATVWTTGVQFPIGAVKGYFNFVTASRLAMGLTQLSNQWVLGVLFLKVKQLGLATHFQLVLRLNMCGAIHSLPNTSTWQGAWLSRGYTFMA